MAIWQDMVTADGFTGGYQTVQRFVGKLRGSDRPEASGVPGLVVSRSDNDQFH